MTREPTEMELRCAKALWQLETGFMWGTNQIGDGRPVAAWVSYLPKARAVIDELRKPTYGMIEVAERAACGMRVGGGKDPAAVAHRQTVARIIYLGAIDAASPPEETP